MASGGAQGYKKAEKREKEGLRSYLGFDDVVGSDFWWAQAREAMTLMREKGLDAYRWRAGFDVGSLVRGMGRLIGCRGG